MKAAISVLEVALENLETSELIHREEGNVEQADLCAGNAAEIRRAIGTLRAHGQPVFGPAVATLETALSNLETNEPIHRAEGHVEQADLCAAQASDIRRALAYLRV